jgi:phosphohistidine phosphatase
MPENRAGKERDAPVSQTGACASAPARKLPRRARRASIIYETPSEPPTPMDLLIVRHAIAFDRDAHRWPDDRKRPLTAEGAARARQAAKGLKRLVDRPQCLLTSPLTRARQTAEILTEFARWPTARDCPSLAPGESAEAALEALRAESHSFIAVVGHQPGLSKLIAASVPGAPRARAFDLKKVGAALLSFDGAPRAGHAVLRWLIAPSLLRSSR